MNQLQKHIGLLLLASSMGVSASTLDAQTGINIDNFDVYIAPLNRTVSSVNQFNWTGYALTQFDGAGAPSVGGSTFTDHIIINATGFLDSTGTSILSTGLNDSYQLTAVIEASGVITEDGTGRFAFTNLNSFGMYVDTNTNGITAANYLTGSLADFTDDYQVVSGGGLTSQTTVPPSNVGILNPTLGANGEFNLQFNWLEVLANAGFLREAGTSTSLFDVYDPINSLTAGEVTFQASDINGTKSGNGTDATAQARNIAILDNLKSMFGITGGTTYIASISTTPDTNLATVPEPTSIALLGLGLLGLAANTRRRRTV